MAPGMSRLFIEFCAGDSKALAFYGGLTEAATSTSVWLKRTGPLSHPEAVIETIAAQNSDAALQGEVEKLRRGAGTVVTGQQVGLFGGPLFTAFKAATALARARQAEASGLPHVGIFWLATEDHDFAEVNHVAFPARHEIRRLEYTAAPAEAIPVGGVVLDESIDRLMDQAWELLGPSEATEALASAYKPGRTFAEAFGDFYRKVFASEGLLVLDAGGRALHQAGAPVLSAAIERADELHVRLVERTRALQNAGYHAQVAVMDGDAGASSLLFLIQEGSGARIALKRQKSSATEPGGLWLAGREKYTTEDLLGILASEPERISPSALLRPVFQDYLLSTSLTIGGPAEVAYFAQSAVLFEEILGRMTPVQARLSGTLIEPAVDELLHRYEIPAERVLSESEDSLKQLLGARSMPVEGKRRLASSGNALDAELASLLEYMHALDEGLGRSAETAASKMRYQMNRLRRLGANFQLAKETSLGRHAGDIVRAIFPGGALQERVFGAAYFLARANAGLAQDLVEIAMDSCPGHRFVRI